MNNESTDQRDKFIEDLSGRIDDRKSIYKRINRIQWITMLLVVTAGFFTSAAGVAHNQNFIISNPIALIVFGLIAAVGTAVNQYINTQNRSPVFHHTMKIALHGIRSAVQYEKMSVSQASQLATRTLAHPDEVIDAIYSIKTEESRNKNNK